MNNNFEHLIAVVSQHGISVSEDEFEVDLEQLAETANEVFWEELHRSEDYDEACDVARTSICTNFAELSYVAEKLEDTEEDWNESEVYYLLRELLATEIFDRANLPEEDEALETINAEQSEFDDEFDEDEDI